jgi:Zn-dependent peptidase ImmA (M78 family)
MRLQISAELALRAEREPAAERLLRSTLAHEAAHVLLHRVLFLRESRSLFSGLATRTELCRTIGVARPGYSGEWWEWQANRGMAALLMPAGRLRNWLAEQSPSPATAGEGRLRVSLAVRAAAADAFGVSSDAIKRRLAQLDALALLQGAGALT